MKSKAKFFHAGCPVCVSAEQGLANLLDPTRVDVESVHLGQAKNRIGEAEQAGVRSVPALVLDGAVFHINHGADLAAIK
jgi:glutaredoxin